ncbi:MAG TPA: 6-phosphogluconolactonase, partial [Microlunatus sp.]|nr:6-phosphogluconolactonase [Microlunatus sp.]
PPERISLTLEVINRSAEVWFCVTGSDKAGAARLAFSGAGPIQVPAAGVRGRERTLWLVDREAASQLPPNLVQHGLI